MTLNEAVAAARKLWPHGGVRLGIEIQIVLNAGTQGTAQRCWAARDEEHSTRVFREGPTWESVLW